MCCFFIIPYPRLECNCFCTLRGCVFCKPCGGRQKARSDPELSRMRTQNHREGEEPGRQAVKQTEKDGGKHASCKPFFPLALRSALCAFDGALYGTDLPEAASVRRGRRMDELRQTDGGAATDGWRRCGRRRRRQPLLSCPQEKTREPVPDSGRLLRSALILPAGEDAGAERPSERVRSG